MTQCFYADIGCFCYRYVRPDGQNGSSRVAQGIEMAQSVSNHYESAEESTRVYVCMDAESMGSKKTRWDH
jgi:hypothetical protein